MSYEARLEKLQTQLSLQGCEAMLVQDPIDIFYMTGLDLSLGTLLVHTRGATLLVDHRYLEICQKRSPFPVLESGSHLLETLMANSDFSHILNLGFDTEKTTYSAFLRLEEMTKKANDRREQGNLLTLTPIENPIKWLRVIKSEEEIVLLTEAAELGSKGFDFVCSKLKEGVTEIEVATALEIFWKELGGRNVAFEPIIAFDKNTSMPHHRSGATALFPNCPVLIDIGVCWQHYHSDMTRMAFFGEPKEEICTIHTIVKEAQLAALALCRPGVTIGDLDKAARDAIASKGYGDFFTHSLGHGVGLEIHEFPIIKNCEPYQAVKLESGMVVTIEPGIYLKDIGGVRIEDTVLIHETGYTSLTQRNTDPVLIDTKG